MPTLIIKLLLLEFYIEFINLKWKRAARLQNFLDNKTNVESIISPLSGFFAKQTLKSNNHVLLRIFIWKLPNQTTEECLFLSDLAGQVWFLCNLMCAIYSCTMRAVWNCAIYSFAMCAIYINEISYKKKAMTMILVVYTYQWNILQREGYDGDSGFHPMSDTKRLSIIQL